MAIRIVVEGEVACVTGTVHPGSVEIDCKGV